MSAAKEWVLPPGYRALHDIVQEYGRDHAQTKLISGQWQAFKLHHNSGDLEPIHATTWCVAHGRTWLEGGSSSWTEILPEKFGLISYVVIVLVSERQPQRQRKAPQADRIKLAIAKCFPNGTDEISTKVVHKAVVGELAPDSKKRGLADPSETSVKRALGRRK